MKGVFDTNILIDFLSGNTKAKIALSSYDSPTISIISWIEILVGAESKEEALQIEGFLKNFSVVPLSEQVARLAVEARRNRKIKIPDAIIYATAKSMECQLITRNTKDFNSKDPAIRIPYQI